MTCNPCTLYQKRELTIDEIIEAAFISGYSELKADPERDSYGAINGYRKLHLQQMKKAGPKVIFERSKRKAIVAARFMVYWYLNKMVGMTQDKVNELFGRNRSGVSFAISRINQREYDPFLNGVFERFNDRIQKLTT